MTKTIAIAPVRKNLQVKATPARAFEVFTAGMSRWWPASHSTLKSPMKDAVVEPRAGGRWYQVGEDASQCEIGSVLVWDPPARLVLAWQLNAQWEYDPSLLTEIEVRFVAEGANATRIEFEHRHLERMGDAAETVRASIDSPGGWSEILEKFAEAAAAQERT